MGPDQPLESLLLTLAEQSQAIEVPPLCQGDDAANTLDLLDLGSRDFGLPLPNNLIDVPFGGTSASFDLDAHVTASDLLLVLDDLCCGEELLLSAPCSPTTPLTRLASPTVPTQPLLCSAGAGQGATSGLTHTANSTSTPDVVVHLADLIAAQASKVEMGTSARVDNWSACFSTDSPCVDCRSIAVRSRNLFSELRASSMPAHLLAAAESLPEVFSVYGSDGTPAVHVDLRHDQDLLLVTPAAKRAKNVFSVFMPRCTLARLLASMAAKADLNQVWPRALVECCWQRLHFGLLQNGPAALLIKAILSSPCLQSALDASPDVPARTGRRTCCGRRPVPCAC